MKSLRPGLPAVLSQLIAMYEDLNIRLLEKVKEYSESVEALWHKVKEPNDPVEAVYGVDGSKMAFETQSLTLFSVRALAVCVPVKKRCEFQKIKEVAGVVTPPVKSNDRAILYMETLETELVNEIIGEGLATLADGALSMIAKCRTFEGYACPCKANYSDISSLARDEALDAPCKLCLECKLKQLQVARILELKPENLFYVAKKYHSNDVFKDEIFDDLSIIYMTTTYINEELDGPGVTVPMEKEVRLPLLNKKGSVWFFYAKFKEGGNVYYVEVPKPITLEEASNFVASLSGLVTRDYGYPLPLLLAHKMVEYPQSAMQKMLQKTKMFVRTGREGL